MLDELQESSDCKHLSARTDIVGRLPPQLLLYYYGDDDHRHHHCSHSMPAKPPAMI